MIEPDTLKAPRNRSIILIRIGVIASTAYFIGVIIWASRSLTFFWDDYEVIGLIADNPIDQMFINGVGHFGPLWRLFFLIEVYVFGPHYFLYTAISALLAAIGFWGFAWALKPVLGSYFWLIIPASIVYFTSLGAMAQIVVAVGSEFTLGFAFAGMAAYIYSRTLRLVWPLTLMVLSGLSLNGTLPVNYAMFSAVVVTYVLLGKVHIASSRLFTVVFGGLGLTISWLAASAIFGSLNPSPYYAAASSDLSVALEPTGFFEQVWNILTTSTGLSISWIIAPLLPGAVVVPDLMSRITILIMSNLVLFILIMTAATAFLIFILRKKPSFRRERGIFIIVMWLIPIIIWAALVAYTRPGAFVTERYANIWLPPVLFLLLSLVLLFALLQKSGITRILIIPISTLLVANSIFGLLMAPQTAIAAANIERPRMDLSWAQHELMFDCLSTEAVTPYDEISPLLSGADFCKVSRFLLQESLLSRY